MYLKVIEDPSTSIVVSAEGQIPSALKRIVWRFNMDDRGCIRLSECVHEERKSLRHKTWSTVLRWPARRGLKEAPAMLHEPEPPPSVREQIVTQIHECLRFERWPSAK